MPVLILPRRLAPPPAGAGNRAVWDFAASESLDISGNGFGLTTSGASRVTQRGGRAGWLLDGGADQVISAGAVIGDSDWFSVLAWVWVDPGGSGFVVTRGRDGYGSGWSITLQVGADGTVGSSIVLGGTQFSSSAASKIVPGAWNAVGMLCLRQGGAEPSFLSTFVNGVVEGRATLAGLVYLRASSVATEIGRLNASLSSGMVVGRISVRIVPLGTSEPLAVAQIGLDYEHERQFFKRREHRLYFDLGAGGGALPASAAGTVSPGGSATPSAQVALGSVAVALPGGSAGASVSVPLSAASVAVSGGAADPVVAVTLSASGLAQAAAQAGLSVGVLQQASAAAQAAGNATLAAQIAALAAGSAQPGGNASGSAAAPGSLSATGGAQASGGALAEVVVQITAAGLTQAMGAGFLVVAAPLVAFSAAAPAGSATGQVTNGAAVLIPDPRFTVRAGARDFTVRAVSRLFRVGRDAYV